MQNDDALHIEDKVTVDVLSSIGKAFYITAFIISLSTIVLRVIDLELLRKTSYGGIVFMNPLSSILFMLLAIAVGIVQKEASSPRSLIVSNFLCYVVIVIGALKIITSLLGVSMILDELLFKEQIALPPDRAFETNVHTMAPNTGLTTVLIAVSIILTNKETTQLFKIAQFLDYLVTLIALLSIYGYIYRIEDLYGYLESTPISFHSSVCSFLLAGSVLFLRPHRGSMAQLIGENPIEIVLMRFLALLIPLLTGLIKIYGENKGWYGKEFGTALFAAITFAISMILLGWKSSIQSKLRSLRRKTETQINQERETFRRILDISPTAISIVDIKSELFIFANEMNKNTFRLNDESLENKKYSEVLAEIVPESDKELVVGRLSRIKKLKPDQYEEVTYRLYDKDGKANWFISRAFGFEYSHNEMKKAIINLLNITKQKKTHAKLEEKKKEIKRKNEELSKINDELKSFYKDFKKKVDERTRKLEESEQKCKKFFERSFEGILRYSIKDIDFIDTGLSVEEQIQLIRKHAYIAEANQKLAEMHDYDSPDILTGMPITEFLSMSDEDKAKLIKVFIESGYRFENQETAHYTKDGHKIDIVTNMIGMVKDNKLYGAWGTQKKHGD